MVKRRLFFALWPDDVSRQKLDRINQSICHAGRRLKSENLHVTLLFIGNVEEEWLDKIYTAAARIKAESIQLQFNEVDFWKKPRVLCLVCNRQPMSLYRLVNQLNAGMAAMPVRLETRPFRAHITLARKITEKPAQVVCSPVTMKFDRFALVESLSTRQGVNYQVLQYWPLSG